jgi:hypothetical protein
MPTAALAKSEPHATHLQQEMKLFNTYLGSIQTELKRKEPQMSELHIFSTLMLESAYKIQSFENKKIFHENLKDLLRDVKSLQKYSKKNQYPAALKQAQSLKTNCLACHKKLR